MAEATRTAKTERRFFNAKGEESARAGEDTVRATITFLGEGGGVLELKREDFQDGVFNAAAWFGFVTSITNAAGGNNAALSPFERAAERLSTLEGEDGEWQGERDGGPQTGLVLEAVSRIGYDKAAIKAKLQANELTIAQLSSIPEVEDMMFTIRAEKLAERQKAAKAKDRKPGADLKTLLG